MDAITSLSIINYKAALTKSECGYLSYLSSFFKKWHSLGYPGIDEDVPRLLKSLRLQGSKKGEAVLTRDPYEGPFVESEFTAILSSANDAYAKVKISLREYLLVLLFSALGPRPVQLASLKVIDFRVINGSNGAIEYFLNIPRAKQWDASNRREKFTTRVLIAEIGKLIAEWVDIVQGQFAEEVDKGFVVGDLPIFPPKGGRDLEMTDGFRYHTRGDALSDEIVAIFDRLSIISARTGQALNVTPLRFRRNLGTRAAEEGHGELIIAQLLDHSDTQNVQVYVQSTSKVLERIDSVLSQHLAPLAQAFLGKIISNASEAERGSDPRARIRSPYAPEKDNGVCGKYGFCSASAPIACYTCRNFQAWVDGPHDQILKLLLTERERVLAITGDSRIASANDQTILAVKAVIGQCIAKKAAGPPA
ncbi:site-specific integrase [Geomonas nitrogeniifigens]|nr:site-specific integrase [Geomonas nitrogeniifigens]